MNNLSKNSDNWLLSYSDLFLLVLSFFVLRHPLLEAPKEILKGKKDQIFNQIGNSKVFEEFEKNNFTDFEIKESWFNQNDELTVNGEENLIIIKKQYLTSAKQIKIEYINSDKFKETSSLKRLEAIIANLLDYKVQEIELNLIQDNSLDSLNSRILVIN